MYIVCLTLQDSCTALEHSGHLLMEEKLLATDLSNFKKQEEKNESLILQPGNITFHHDFYYCEMTAFWKISFQRDVNNRGEYPKSPQV